jgi:hypothetical protein
MSGHTVENLVKQVLALSPEEQQEFRARLDAPSPNVVEDEFSKMLRETGFGQPRKAGPRAPNPTPVRVQGKPLSEQLIEERR